MISDRLSGSARRHRRAATRHLPFAVAALALAVFAAHIIEQRLSARTTLAEGQEAFRRGDFGRAVDRFRSALGIDPALVPLLSGPIQTVDRRLSTLCFFAIFGMKLSQD